MKIAFQTVPQWEGVPHAEAELAGRFKQAAEVLGLETVVSSDARVIENFSPDIVIPLHFFLPKLFDAFTVGCMWNPVPYFTERSQNWDFVKSYDGYGVASEFQEQLIRRIKFKSPTPYLLLPLYPSANATEFEKPKTFGTPVYIGTNWTNTRHKDLFLHSGNVHVYGRKDRWQHLPPGVYKGELPFGGQHVIDRYRSAGIGLALHHQAHIDEGIPNMRPFEIAASGAVMIADQSPFVREAFGDNALYIDTSRETEEVIDALANQCNWISSHKKQAIEMARACNEVFNKEFCLEALLVKLVDSVTQFKNRPESLKKDHAGEIDIIVRWDPGSPIQSLQTLESLVHQNSGYAKITIAVPGDQDEGSAVRKRIMHHLPVLNSENMRILPLSSEQSWLYEGIRSSRADYLAFAGAGDVLFSDHIEVLSKVLSRHGTAVGSYGGVVSSDRSSNGEKLKLSEFFDFEHEGREKYPQTCSALLVRRKLLPWQVFHQKLPALSGCDEAAFLSLLAHHRSLMIFSEKVTCRVEEGASTKEMKEAAWPEELVGSIREKAETHPQNHTDAVRQADPKDPKPGFRRRLSSILSKP